MKNTSLTAFYKDKPLNNSTIPFDKSIQYLECWQSVMVCSVREDIDYSKH